MGRDQNDLEREYDTENEPSENLDRGEAETEFKGSSTRSKSAGRATGRTASKRAGSKTGTARAGTRGKRPQRPSRTPR